MEAGSAVCLAYRPRNGWGAAAAAHPARVAARETERHLRPACYWRRPDHARGEWRCAITGTAVEPGCASTEVELCVPRLALRLALGTVQLAEVPRSVQLAVHETACRLEDLDRLDVRPLRAAERRRLEALRARAERMRQQVVRTAQQLELVRQTIGSIAEGRSPTASARGPAQSDSRPARRA